jgi:hypothetical protein
MTRKDVADVDGGLAVAELPKRSPTEIAADAAARSAEMRRAALIVDVERWRAIVIKITSGAEPSGEELRDITELASRLKLPQGSLAAHVAVLEQERKLQESFASVKENAAKAEVRSPLLQKELEAAHRSLTELKAEADANFYAQADAGHLPHRVGEYRQKNLMMFRPVELLAEQMIAEVSL